MFILADKNLNNKELAKIIKHDKSAYKQGSSHTYFTIHQNGAAADLRIYHGYAHQ